MAGVNITFPNKSKKEFKKGATGLDIASSIGPRLAKDALAIKVNGEIQDLTKPINKDAEIEILTFASKEGKKIFWHSASHLMTQAVLRLRKGENIGLGVGVATDDGYYQDYDMKEIHPDELKKIENEMQKIVNEKLEITQKDVPKKQALAFYKKDPYKIELTNAVPGEKVSMYTQGEFDNLCKGPHAPNTSYIKAFKLMKLAGAYWRGDSKNKMLTRIYGVAFPSDKELKQYLTLLEEAEKRDHRKIGKQLDLFSFHEEAPGMPFFHNKGTFIFNTLVDFMTSEMKKLGYEINKTPLILNKQLWVQSGHWDHYKENMYFTKIDAQDFAVKPMNCPGNLLIYKTTQHSYRELPIKAGEFGVVHRHELSGVLSGLLRVRCFTQDDAHVFCTEEQIQEQIIELIELVDRIYSTFNLKYEIELSTKPEKAMGDPKLWEKAEKALANDLYAKKIKYKINPGDGAFYGPKIDFHVKDAIGRKWQCGTIQLDFSMPEKFDLTYEGKDGKKHRPVMLHRAVYGALERFIAILVEHYAGRFPLWLSPVQIRILTVADKHIQFADKIKKQIEQDNLMAEIDKNAETMNKKVRDAQLQHIPLIITIGDKEVESNTLAVRTLDGKIKFGMGVDEFINKVKDNVKKRKKEIDFL